MLSYLILGATFAFAAAVQPGQFQAYLISQTLAHGWRRTVPAALAPLLSDAPIICLVLLVLTHVPPLFVRVLQLTGGVFLLYLAFGAYKSWRHYDQALTAPRVPATRTVLNAAVVNLLNPNPYIAWALVLGPLLLDAWRRAPVTGVIFVVAFYLTLIVSTTAIILAFAVARSFGPRVARTLVGVSAVALAGFGVYQLWAGSTSLLLD